MQLLQQQQQQPPMKFNQNTRALVGSPIHQYHKYSSRPLQRPRAASSSSMLNQEQSGLLHQQHHHHLNHPNVQVRGGLFHPYQHLPGASLSLQMLNSQKISGAGSSNSGTSGSCVYLRPEQNIPEVFANPGNSVFKPIDEVDNNSDVNDNNDLAGNSNRSETTGAISRDDIVVTMRSVNV